jgi:hypothetical protein
VLTHAPSLQPFGQLNVREVRFHPMQEYSVSTLPLQLSVRQLLSVPMQLTPFTIVLMPLSESEHRGSGIGLHWLLLQPPAQKVQLFSRCVVQNASAVPGFMHRGYEVLVQRYFPEQYWYGLISPQSALLEQAAATHAPLLQPLGQTIHCELAAFAVGELHQYSLSWVFGGLSLKLQKSVAYSLPFRLTVPLVLAVLPPSESVQLSAGVVRHAPSTQPFGHGRFCIETYPFPVGSLRCSQWNSSSLSLPSHESLYVAV